MGLSSSGACLYSRAQTGISNPADRPQARPLRLERDDFLRIVIPLSLTYYWSMMFSENRYPLFGIMLQRDTPMLYIIYQEDRADGATIRAATRDSHLAYLEQHKDILVLGGALLADDGRTRLGSCLLINVPDRAAAEAFSRDEPFRKAGLFKTVTITRMRRGQWNPAAIPQTPEGN
jgi:uncharacterized protein YciI